MKARGGIAALAFLTALVVSVGAALGQIRTGRAAPDVAGGPWLNSPPLTMEGLRGRVVLVEFWTHG